MTGLDGVLVVDKPGGLVSMRVVERVRRITKIRKAGHAGTLDPMATGVLPICLGQATKIASLLLGEDKEYHATVRLGIETNTYDLEGKTLETAQVPSSLTFEIIKEQLSAFTGTITQRPPAFSAIRVDGERLYKKARRGETVEVPEREVVIYELELLDFTPPDLCLRVRCGTGTYIRSLAFDLGRRIGTGACLAALRRTRVGSLSEQQARSLDELADLSQQGELLGIMIPPAQALAHLPQVTLDQEAQRRVRMGQQVEGAPDQAAALVRLLDEEGCLVALAEPTKGRLQPKRVFV